ncbi:hypothetical protein [Mobilicoccus caccae]|uniref:hypothetical protein n=1 Tax=Mobilicoccus caccae TaxID=1859295 RepID=UPI0024E096C3|nr:hypothetical protein [Mobilicoccus caccae]
MQLRFRDLDGELQVMNAALLGEALQGMAEFVGSLSAERGLGDGPPPEVLVRPIREGSVVVDTLIHAAQQDPFGALTVAGGGAAGIATALRVSIRSLRVTVSSFDHLPTGTTKVTWSDGESQEIPTAAWKALQSQKRRTRRALGKIMAPLAGRSDVLEVREGGATQTSEEITESSPVVVEATTDDYRAARPEPQDSEDSQERTFEVEGRLKSVDFDDNSKWQIVTLEGSRKAIMEDYDFLERVDRGLPLRKDDIFQFLIREEVTSPNGRTKRSWTILEVTGHRQGYHDDDDEQGSDVDAD